MVFDQNILRKHTTDFYRNLLDITTTRTISLQSNFWDSYTHLIVEQINFLEPPFNEEEIKHVIFSCDPNKAPGQDGFSFQFYQSFWDLVFRDIFKLVNAFYFNQLDVSKLNLASICLIPKKDEANLITNFRTIRLINYSFKIITKLLADRLATVMDSLIDHSQNIYIKGHYIMNNVVCAHEVLHQVRKIKKLKVFYLKLILKKFLIEFIGTSYLKFL
jgi:Reverse transcriptase (RNA-dependent DNA polymerase)